MTSFCNSTSFQQHGAALGGSDFSAILPGHVSAHTPDRYVRCKQRLRNAVDVRVGRYLRAARLLATNALGFANLRSQSDLGSITTGKSDQLDGNGHW